MKVKTTEEVKARILAFMLYHGYIGKRTIPEKELMKRFEKEGWLHMSSKELKKKLESKFKK